MQLSRCQTIALHQLSTTTSHTHSSPQPSYGRKIDNRSSKAAAHIASMLHSQLLHSLRLQTVSSGKILRPKQILAFQSAALTN